MTRGRSHRGLVYGVSVINIMVNGRYLDGNGGGMRRWGGGGRGGKRERRRGKERRDREGRRGGRRERGEEGERK